MIFSQKEPDRVLNNIETPVIRTASINISPGGKYKTKTGNPKGLVVHFTAGRSKWGERDALSTLENLSYRGLGCLVMSCDGIIYRAQNQPINVVGFHAGNSIFGGTKGLSYYCMGMEICCAGKVQEHVNEDQKRRRYLSWFKEEYSEYEVRFIPKQTENMAFGYYHKFTEAQEKALVEFCLWQKNINSEFNCDWVLGHDEICVPKGRKTDPGGSLSLSMPKFRQKLKDLS